MEKSKTDNTKEVKKLVPKEVKEDIMGTEGIPVKENIEAKKPTEIPNTPTPPPLPLQTMLFRISTPIVDDNQKRQVGTADYFVNHRSVGEGMILAIKQFMKTTGREILACEIVNSIPVSNILTEEEK